MDKLKLRYRISMLVQAGMLAAVSLGTITATANNHDDTTFSFNFGFVNQMHYTESRPKEDTSSMYAKNSRGAGVFIYNNIYEDGYRAAILGARSTSTGSCNGLWSPDSI